MSAERPTAAEIEAHKRSHGCLNPNECGCSSDMFENMTFGWGDLDTLGYWEHECAPCARAFEIAFPDYKGKCIPLEDK